MEKAAVQRFFGIVGDVKEGGAYCFVSTVTDPYGKLLDTNGDVYLGRQDADGPLEKDLRFAFGIEPDPRRAGKFKATHATVTRHLPVLAASQNQLAVMGVRTGYHDHAKAVDPVEVRKAVNNRPFSDAINASLDYTVHLQTEADVDSFLLGYLKQSFPGLEAHGVRLDMNAAGNPDERRMIETSIADHKEQGMDVQAASLTTMYELYVASCEMLRECRSRGVPAPGMHMSMGMLRLMLGGVDVQMRSGGDHRRMEEIKAQAEESVATIRFLRDNDLLRPGCVIPMKNIADVLLAAPVWYVAAKGNGQIADTWEQSDPRPDDAVRYFAGLMGKNQVWAHFYQIWNRRTRPLNRYEGDQIPPHVMRAIKVARQHFDYVVIATPYHDVAGREWEDPNWQRLIDPFLYGFKKGLPYIYFLGRWSDSGLFPLMPEMVADTMSYLRANAERLRGFGGNPYWHFVDTDSGGFSNNGGACLASAESRLPFLARQLVQAFDDGTLLEVLRAEKPLPTIAA